MRVEAKSLIAARLFFGMQSRYRRSDHYTKIIKRHSSKRGRGRAVVLRTPAEAARLAEANMGLLITWFNEIWMQNRSALRAAKLSRDEVKGILSEYFVRSLQSWDPTKGTVGTYTGISVLGYGQAKLMRLIRQRLRGRVISLDSPSAPNDLPLKEKVPDHRTKRSGVERAASQEAFEAIRRIVLKMRLGTIEDPTIFWEIISRSAGLVGKPENDARIATRLGLSTWEVESLRTRILEKLRKDNAVRKLFQART